jgi:hypothetical protein
VSPGAGKDEAARRRLREKVFGDVLPDTTTDELEQESAETRSSGNDEWLRSNIPPHHG